MLIVVNILGLLYQAGEVVKQDYTKAAFLFEKACVNDKKVSCNQLAFLFIKAEGRRQNAIKAQQLFIKEYDSGNKYACDYSKYLNNKVPKE